MPQTPATAMLRLRPPRPAARSGGASGRARAATISAAVLLLAFAALLATPTAAQAQTTHVSNFGQGTDSDTQFSRDMSQPFTTGSQSGGYALSSVSIKTNTSTAGRTFAMSVCTVDANVHPTSSCTALTAPSSFPSGAQTLVFSASSDINLDADTPYTLLISGASSTITYVMTAANGEDSGGTAGWSLADNAEFKNASDVWTDVTNGKSLRVTIFGPSTNTAPGAPTDLTAGANGQNQIDLSWAAPSNTGGAAITGYKIEVSADGGTSWSDLVANTSSTGTTYSHTGLSAGNVRHYRVSAINSVGTGDASDVAGAITATADGTFVVGSDWGLKPSPVAAGSSFRLLFLSSTKRDPSSTDIADYNAFIQNRAASGHSAIQIYGSHFRVVGCTDDDDARDNTATTYTASAKGVPIYWLNGAKAADDYEDFYDGSWDDEANDKNESGTNGPDTSQVANFPLTGCDHDGTAASFSGQSRALGASSSRVGAPNNSSLGHGPLSSNSAVVNDHPFYGLSPVFTVPTTATLVSNLSETTHATTETVATATDSVAAQQFTTGSSTYTVTAAQVDVASKSASPTLRLRICPQGTGNVPDSANCLGTLSAPTTLGTGEQEFRSTGDTITLAASTRYFLVADVSGTGAAVNLQTAFADGEESEYGWTIANDLRRSGDGGSTYTSDGSNSLKIAIVGYDTTTITTTNTAATGKPGIDGAPQRGETLTATKGTIADDDGIDDRTFPDDFTFQWATGGSDITGATSSTYEVPAATALGSTFTVKVSFSDDNGNSEGPLESDATTGTIEAKEDCATDRADSDWCATVTVGSTDIGPVTTAHGYWGNTFGSLDDTGIEYGGETWRVQEAFFQDSPSTDSFIIQLNAHVPLGSTFDLGGTTLTADATSEQSAVGRYAWNVTTNPSWIDGQKVTVSANLAPVVTAATVSGDTLVLTFAEDLDTGSEPDPSAFTVAVDGTAVTVDDVDMSGATVTLELASAVTSGQAVTVAYAPPASNPLQDESGTDAPAFAAGDFTVTNNTGNNVATGKPVITGAAQRGETLTATLGTIEDDDGLTTKTFPDDFTFQWEMDGSDISGATDATYDVPAATALGSTFTVEVSFSDDGGNSEGPLESDATDGTIEARGDCPTGNDWCTAMTVAVAAPSPARRSGFSAGNFGSLDDTAIEVGAATWTVSAIVSTVVQGGDDQIEVLLDAFVPRGSVFNLGGTEFVVDADSERVSGDYYWTVSSAPSWSEGQRVTVSANLAPGVTSATVAADKLVLTFTENLDTASEPDPSAFTVTVAGTAVTVNDVDMSGKTVTLTLASAVTGVQIVTVAYAPPSMNPLQDTSGTAAPAFTAQAEQTLVSNTGQTLTGNGFSGRQAQPFTTGDNAAGYVLTGVGVYIKDVTNQNQSNIRVRIFTVDSDGEPDSALYTLTNPSSIVINAVATFTAPPNSTLEANTTYAVEVGGSSGGGSGPSTQETNSSAEDSGAAANWSIGDTLYYISSGSWTTSTALLPMQIKGSITPVVVANNPATGAPAITGAAQVGMTLTADVSDIMDDDGVGTLTYQWVRITEGDVETNIGTDSSTYTLTSAEQGHNIRVDVSFTDDGNNDEGPIESGETWLVMPAAVSNCDTSDPWCATLTVGHEQLTMQQIDDGLAPDVGFRASPSYGSVSPATFTHDGDQYTVTILAANYSASYELFLATMPSLPSDGAGLTLHVQNYLGELSLPLSEASFNSNTNVWSFDQALFVEPTAPLSEAPLLRAFGRADAQRVGGATDVGTQVAVRLSASTNNPATGAPTISGAAQVGMTLTADVSDIMDDDGVGTLTYQWVRITEGDTETNIGTNASTYTLTAAEKGHNIRVDVSFTDNGNNAEGPLESGETWLVMPTAVPNCGGSDPWCATVTAGHQLDMDGFPEAVGFRASPSYGSVSPATFTHDGVPYTVTLLNVVGANDIAFQTSPNLPAGGAGLTLHLQRYSGELDLALSDADFLANDSWFFERGAVTALSDPLSAVPLLRVHAAFARTPGYTDVGTQVAVRLSAAGTAPVPVPADWALIPSGLGPGDSFRLIFLSSTKRDASSTDIADYNTFVQNRAAAGHAAIQEHASLFQAVGCTADVDARDNTYTTYTASAKGVPIYWLDGSKVADDYEDFYDESWDDEANDRNESGTDGPDTSQVSNFPFTGCKHDGTEAFGLSNVLRALGASTVRVSRPDSTQFDSGPLSSGETAANTATRPFYGLSPVFMVAAPAQTGTTRTLVSNTALGFSGTSQFALHSQAFTTGPHASGYRLVGIGVGLGFGFVTPSEVSIYSNDPLTHEPGTKLYTLTAPEVGSVAGIYTFSAPAGATLDASTTYHVHVETGGRVITREDVPGADPPALPATDDPEYAALAADLPQWSIAENRLRRDSDSEAWSSVTGQSALIAVKGFLLGSQTTTPGTATTVRFGAAQYTATEGGSPATVTVHLNPAPAATVTIPLTVARRGTASPADFSGIPPSVTFASGQSSRSFVVRATDDNRRDPDERLLLGFGELPPGIAAGIPARATVALQDNDGPGTARVSFYPGALVASENGGSARVTIFLDQPLDQEVTIRLTKTHLGGATARDYTGLPSSVTFAAGETETSIYVSARDDAADDDGESVVIGFDTLPTGVTVGGEPTKTVNLTDDDGISEWTVWFDSSSYTATEGGAGARVTVHLSDPWKPWTGTDLTVPLHAIEHGGGATTRDYEGLPSSVTFAGGATTASFTVRATPDTHDDDGESVTIGFGRLPEDLRQGTGPATATVALEDTDGVRAIVVSFGAATYSATEGGQAATVQLELDRSRNRSVTIPLTFTRLGGATADDHSAIPGSVTFGSGVTARSFMLTATDDALDDDGGSVRIEFGTLPDGVSRGRLATTTVNLVDNDGDTPQLTVNFNAHHSRIRTLREGGASGSLRILADKQAPSPVTIPLTVTHTGGATAADYTGLPPSVTIQEGDDDVTIILRAVEDTDDDDGEGFRVDFGELPAGVTAGTWGSSATFQIVDNDGPRNAVLADGWVEGSELTLRYTDPLDGNPALAGRDFVVVAGPVATAATVAVESVAVSGADAVLTLARGVRPEEPVALTYLAAPMHPLRTLGGGPAEAPTDFPVRNETSVVKMQEALPARAQIDGLSAGTRSLPAALAAAEGAKRLDLSGRGLTDLAPLVGLTGLLELDLRGNALTDLTPLAGLTDLQVLNLRGNAIIDLAPLAGLTALQALDLQGNAIIDLAPLAGLAQLQALDLSDNRIAAVWPLAGLTGLRELNLRGNAIADIGPLAGLAEPRVLDLSDNRIAAAWPLAGMPGLRRLDLSDNRIADITPLAELHALEVLLLDGNAAADLGPLAHLRKLQNLGLSANAVTDATALAELRLLRRLDLSGNALTDISALGRLSALVWLRLPGNPVGDAASLGQLPALRWLWLDAETPWADPVRLRSDPNEGVPLRVERTNAQERPRVN